MLKKKYTGYLSVAVLLALPFTAQADINIADGNIEDWISGPITNQPDGLGEDEWAPKRAGTSYVLSDSNRRTDSGHKNDNSTNGIYNNSNKNSPFGGQGYDSEAMYLEIVNDTLQIAIVTGLRPGANYSAGDIFFDLDGSVTDNSGKNKTSAADLGDGYEYGMVVYDHDKNGFSDNGSGSWDAGELYSLTDWNYGINSDGNFGNGAELEELHPVTGRAGTQIGSTEVDPALIDTQISYKNVGINDIGAFDGADTHYIIEASIDLLDSSTASGYNSFGDSLFQSLANGKTGTINVHWNPLCNNDWIQYTGTLAYNSLVPPDAIPEPAPLALMAIGLVGFMARKKRS